MELPEKSLRVIHIPEPLLGFGHGQLCEHSKDGLYLYGPSAAGKRPAEISIGVVGTATGPGYFETQIKKMAGFIANRIINPETPNTRRSIQHKRGEKKIKWLQRRPCVESR